MAYYGGGGWSGNGNGYQYQPPHNEMPPGSGNQPMPGGAHQFPYSAGAGWDCAGYNNSSQPSGRWDNQVPPYSADIIGAANGSGSFAAGYSQPGSSHHQLPYSSGGMGTSSNAGAGGYAGYSQPGSSHHQLPYSSGGMGTSSNAGAGGYAGYSQQPADNNQYHHPGGGSRFGGPPRPTGSRSFSNQSQSYRWPPTNRGRVGPSSSQIQPASHSSQPGSSGCPNTFSYGNYEEEDQVGVKEEEPWEDQEERGKMEEGESEDSDPDSNFEEEGDEQEDNNDEGVGEVKQEDHPFRCKLEEGLLPENRKILLQQTFIQKDVDSFQGDVIVGANYVVEYHSSVTWGPPGWVCCVCKFGTRNIPEMLHHLLSYLHRHEFLGQQLNHPYRALPKHVDKKERRALTKQYAAEFFAIGGPGRVRVDFEPVPRIKRMAVPPDSERGFANEPAVIQDMIDKSNLPLVGASQVVEYHPASKKLTFVCELCSYKTDVAKTLLDHLVHKNHQHVFLTQYPSRPYMTKQGGRKHRVVQHCQELNSEEGPGKVRVKYGEPMMGPRMRHEYVGGDDGVGYPKMVHFEQKKMCGFRRYKTKRKTVLKRRRREEAARSGMGIQGSGGRGKRGMKRGRGKGRGK